MESFGARRDAQRGDYCRKDGDDRLNDEFPSLPFHDIYDQAIKEIQKGKLSFECWIRYIPQFKQLFN